MRPLSNDPGYLPDSNPRQWTDAQLAAWLDTIPSKNAFHGDILDEAASRLRRKRGLIWRIWRRVAAVLTRSAGPARSLALDLLALAAALTFAIGASAGSAALRMLL